MPSNRRSTESEAHVLLDQAVLQLMLDLDRQRPWSESEIARMTSTPGDIPAGLARLHAAGVIHRWSDLVTATHAAVYFHEITQSLDSTAEGEHHDDSAVLNSLIARANDDKGPLSEQEIGKAFDAAKRKLKARITDALDRLDGAGLIERRDGRPIASEVAMHLDRILTL
jgi:hypothetical protein